MYAKIRILVKGYAIQKVQHVVASPNSILIQDSGVNVIVDPGSNPSLLLEGLDSAGLTPEDIDFIFITHYHIDHILNIRLFPDKSICDGISINCDDKIIDNSDSLPRTQIKIISTPGHTHEHWSLLVDTEKGTVAIAGDVFWWWNHEKQKTDNESLISHQDSYAYDICKLRTSRIRLLNASDIIIPGHGKPFKT